MSPQINLFFFGAMLSSAAMELGNVPVTIVAPLCLIIGASIALSYRKEKP